LSFEKLKNTIDFFIDKKGNNNKPLSISFMGGGEPMISWCLVKDGILYAKEKSEINNKQINFTIITNGTILTDEMLEVIDENKINISISFEIIEEIQNKQRGQYDKVVTTISKLISKNIIPQINSTITPANVDRMEEMYELLDTQFPKISNMMFEPVTSTGLFSIAENLDIFLNKYTDSFLKIDLKARQKNKSLTSFPYLRTVFPTERACAGEFCLTADGKLSGCYCISTENDLGYAKSIYGEVFEKGDSNNNINIKKENFKNLIEDNVYTKEKCNNCVVKWNCGGGCFYLRSCYPENYQEVFCNFTRNFVQRVILHRFERLYKKQYGKNPQDDIQNVQLSHKILEFK
jgi:radical SAM protein with 4Fe4S-binding SPASM domain